MTVADYLRILKDKFWLLVLLSVIGGSLALAYSETQPKLYQSNTSAMLVYRPGDSTTELLQGSNYVQANVHTYVLLTTSPSVLQPVIDQLGLDESATSLARRISVDTPLNTTVVRISVADEDPGRATEIARAVTASLTRAVSEVAPTVDGEASVRVETIAPASQPLSFVSPNRRLYALVGTAAGLAIAVLAAVMRDQYRGRPRHAADFVADVDLPVLGEIPRTPRGQQLPLTMVHQPTGSLTESMRMVTANLRSASRADVLILTSAESHPGKASIATAVALSMATSGRRTLVVDADLRDPAIAPLLGLPADVGLTSVSAGEVSLADAVQSWGSDNLWVLPSGSGVPDPGQLISSGRLDATIAEARAQFDAVIIATAPVGLVSDALWLADTADGVVLVAQARRTRIRAFQDAVRTLATRQTPVLGVIMTDVARRPGVQSPAMTSDGTGASSPDAAPARRWAGPSSRGK